MNDAPTSPPATQEALHVLLLEDSAFDAELLQASLRLSHPTARLTWTRDEIAFTAALAASCPDLILSDFQLPGYSGSDALDHAQAVCPQVPFIFVSGVIGEDNAVELLKRGATDYVIKSRLARLPVAIDRALAEVRLLRARQAAELRLRQAKEEAERANRAKDRFLAVLSHELRTPLTPIAAAANVLERAAVVPERYRHLLPMIRRNVEIEARLIDDLLDLTALGAGKVTLKLETVDVHALIPAIVEMLAEDIDKRQLVVTQHLQAPHSLVEGDAARLHQVLWNILRNAVKFTPPRGRIEVSTRVAQNQLLVRCSDSGIGIEAAVLPRIFQPFEQADAQVSRQYGGLGLGLAIAHGLVQHHRGRLDVHSDGRDKGATFTLRLPLLRTASSADKAVDPGDAQQADADAVKLLLVEDNLDAAEALRLSLQDLGYQVSHATTVKDALALAAAQHFDVVITDLGLPDGSGIEIGRHLHDSMPVMALSGFGAPRDLLASNRAGFADHLVKPVDPGAVHSAVQRALARRARRPTA